MAASWQYRGERLVLTETGVASNAEIERVFVGEALAQRRLPASRVLWDARDSENEVAGPIIAATTDEKRGRTP